jgi:RNA polymerase sigma-70 factor (ECF subfamily)
MTTTKMKTETIQPSLSEPGRSETPESRTRSCLLACREGDTGAFQLLVETYQGYAFSLAVRFLGNGEDAGDVVQETFIRIWKHLRTFDFRCKFTTWMYRIVINLCRDRIKAQNRRNKHLRPDVAPGCQLEITSHDDQEDAAVKKDLAAVII